MPAKHVNEVSVSGELKMETPALSYAVFFSTKNKSNWSRSMGVQVSMWQ